MGSCCFLCSEARSLTTEHIIPQSLGGKLKANIYCKECNNTLGHSVDAELIRHFGFVYSLLCQGIGQEKASKFEVSEVQTGTKLVYHDGLLVRKNPIVNIDVKDGKLASVDITARTKAELERIVRSVETKYGISGGVTTFHEPRPGPTSTEHSIVVSNPKIRRAIAKIAYGFLCTKIPYNTLISQHFDSIRKYIMFDSECKLASVNYAHTNFLTDYTRPLHKIHVALNSRDRIVLAFVSIFGVFRFTVLLAENYDSVLEWPGLDYTYDPVTKMIVVGNDNFRAPQLSKRDILNPHHTKKMVMEELRRGLEVLNGDYVEGYKMMGVEADSD